MKKNVFLLLTVLFLSCGRNASSQSSLSPDDFETRIETGAGILLLDVRTPEEYQGGHLQGAQNINFYDDDFEQQLARLDKTGTVLVYCEKGGRSASAAEQLTRSGFKNVFDLSGGIQAWKKAGKPVVQ